MRYPKARLDLTLTGRKGSIKFGHGCDIPTAKILIECTRFRHEIVYVSNARRIPGVDPAVEGPRRSKCVAHSCGLAGIP